MKKEYEIYPTDAVVEKIKPDNGNYNAVIDVGCRGTVLQDCGETVLVKISEIITVNVSKDVYVLI